MAGVEKIFCEQISSFGNRAQLVAAIHFVRDGGTLVVTKLDRLAQSPMNLLQLSDQLDANNVGPYPFPTFQGEQR